MEEDFDDPNYVFEYDETAKCCLRWKNPKTPFLKGQECGTLTQNGHWAVQFRGMPRMAHRIIWEMFYELDDKDTIRTKDGDYLNCRISNLVLEPYENKNPQIEAIKQGAWEKVFEYYDGSLYWKDDFWSGANLQILNCEKGNAVHTTEDKDGYLRVKLGNYANYMLMLHRIIYEWHYGKIPKDMQVDHINGINTDNRIENLRCVNQPVNSRNRKKDSRNKTGVPGVRYRKQGSNAYYIAFWRENGKQDEKSFSVNKYGREEAFKLACEKRTKEIDRLNKVYEDDGYTEDHGYRTIN